MPRRVSLPSADDLFRPTVEGEEPPKSVRAVPDRPEPDDAVAEEPEGRKRPSGRVRHDEKMTVYVTSDELLDIEHARLALRRGQGLAVDRGRLVREALALVLADYEENGDDSALVRRLTEG
ncbi:hypothetical protein [Nocardioides dongkuii]|uniref:hypothetical protein n=1 Tax=Nocardioides dongkuii TaxID=2760089 RepID=UPI0015FBCAC5|nr:hypothetical protein [Nocardioides dongkuii]